MDDQRRRVVCEDCERESAQAGAGAAAGDGAGGGLSRREFLRTTAGGVTGGVAAAGLAGAAGVGASMVGPRVVAAEGAKAGKRAAGETLVQQLYGSLNEKQRGKVCFPFEHELRSEVDANWRITDARIGNDFDADQRDLIRQIFMSLHSEEYAGKVLHQVNHDNRGSNGLDACSVALFGEPGTGKFEFVLTGRHVTRRCDGDSVEGAAFGGPIFYGHAAKSFNEGPDHEGNVYWYQALQANQVFEALDGRQREMALRRDPRRERKARTVRLSGEREGLAGVPCGELTADQRGLVKETLTDLLAPFREEDAAEAMKLIEANGGVASLSMAFYENRDIGDDGVWDVWQLEGPAMVWYFRGDPHVHTWVNVRAKA